MFNETEPLSFTEKQEYYDQKWNEHSNKANIAFTVAAAAFLVNPVAGVIVSGEFFRQLVERHGYQMLEEEMWEEEIKTPNQT